MVADGRVKDIACTKSNQVKEIARTKSFTLEHHTRRNLKSHLGGSDHWPAFVVGIPAA